MESKPQPSQARKADVTPAIERAVVGTLIEQGGGTLPPNLSAVLAAAPHSFEDLTLGTLAEAVRRLRDSGQGVNPVTILESIGPDHPGAMLLGSLPDEALPLDAAEEEAKRLVATFVRRKARETLLTAAHDIEAEPLAAGVIIRTTLDALQDLRAEAATNSPDAWKSLAQDGAEIMRAEIPPPTELVDGLLTECGKFMIGGGSKSFKTWLLLDLALSISTGAPFLGRPTLRRRVLYCNLELRAEAFNRRVQTIARHRGIAIERGFFTHLPLRGKLAGLPVGAIVERVLDTARAREAQVVALDPLYKVNAGGDENDAGAVTTLFNELDRLTTEGGLTVLAADHAGKGNQAEKDPLDVFRGSSAKGADVDGAFVMRRHEVADSFTVDVILRELAPVPPFVLGWTFPAFAVRDDLDPAKMKRAKGGRKAGHDPVALLRAIEGTTPEAGISISRWAEAAGIARQTLQTTYLPGFRLKGWIATAGDGNTSRQYITETGRKHLNGGLE